MRNLFFFAMLMVLFQGTAFGIDYCDLTVGKITPVDPVALAAKNIVAASCTGCHGKGATGGAGTFTDILDVDELKRNKFVDLANPKASRIFDAVNTDRMPKAGAKLKLADKAAILAWITAGAPDWTDPGTPLPTTFVGYEQELQCILQDARKIDKKKRGDARNYEWFTLSNVSNSGDKAKFENLGWALDIALNSTAINIQRNQAAVQQFNAYKLDPNGIIRAIFLPNVVKNANDFDLILLPDYLFAIDFSKGNYFDRQTRDDISDLEFELKRLTGRDRPYLRADFVVQEIMIKKYYEFLGIDDKKQNLVDIEKAFGVNADKAVGDLEIDSLVAHRSGVSLFNRTIHRYDSVYTIGGANTSTSYWKTFDVLNEVNTRNFFAFPLGPRGVKFDFFTDKFFDFDAGEQIWQMPNGFQLYGVANAKGQLLREADTRVAFNAHRVHPAFSVNGTPGAIVTGGGCIECHSGGVNFITDQLLTYAGTASGITAAEYNAIKQIFPSQAKWNTNFTNYNVVYQTAHTNVVKNPVTRTSSGEPLTLAIATFLDYLTVADAAGEFNMSQQDFLSCLSHEPGISRAIGLTSAGQVTRDGLDDQFDEIVIACGLGKQILFKVGKGPVVPPPKKKDCDYAIVNNSNYRVSFITDFGKWGANSVLLFPGERKDFTFVGEFDSGVTGVANQISYSLRNSGSYGPACNSNDSYALSGCREFQFLESSGRPQLFNIK